MSDALIPLPTAESEALLQETYRLGGPEMADNDAEATMPTPENGRTLSQSAFQPCDAGDLIHLIHPSRHMQISGGRCLRRDTGISLPLGSGYSVTVDLDHDNTHAVRRVLYRKGENLVKDERRKVLASDVSEVAYQLSLPEKMRNQ